MLCLGIGWWFRNPWTTREVQCCLEPLDFGVICYVELYNLNGSLTSFNSLLKSQLLHETFPGHLIKIVTHSWHSSFLFSALLSFQNLSPSIFLIFISLFGCTES